MNGRELGQIELTLEPHQQRVLQVLARRHHGQKMRLVGHQQMLVAVDDFGLERDGRLRCQFAVVVIAQPRREQRMRPCLVPLLADHLSCGHAPHPVITANGWQALAEKVDQQTLALTGQHHATGADAIAYGQDLGIVGVVHGAKF